MRACMQQGLCTSADTHTHTRARHTHTANDSPPLLAADKDDDEVAPAAPGQYATFWREFGKSLKLGLIEDSANKQRLSKLLRFHTTKSGDKLTSFDEYVSRMKPKQKDIYFLAGV